jgi:membrane protein DedA with SNARE-associated domain
VTHTFVHLIGRFGYLIVTLFLIAEGCGIPVPSATMMVTAAAVAGAGALSIWGVGIAGTIGGVLGGMAGYLIGAQGGLRLIRRYGAKLHMDQQRLTRTRRFFERRGLWAVFVSRFIGVVRIFVPMFAGIARMPFGRFSAANAAGSLGTAVVYCALGYLFGRDLPALEHHITEATLIAAALLVVWFVYTRVRAGRAAQRAEASR